MDISIVIPVYNGEETLKLCLDSVKAMSVPEGMNLEILLVNDGSTDRTKEIALSYEGVAVIDLEKNSGRIIARKTGAERAKYEDILFVDVRIELAGDILNKIMSINYQPLMAGNLNHEKYRSEYDTLLYLIRRKFYYPYFPQTAYAEELWIDETNFLKAPKGTGCLFIKREMFLESLPYKLEKDTSDDTAILKNIVFSRKTKILRHTGLSVRYNSRTDKNVGVWVNHRGKTFADHYLRFFNIYSLIYYASILISLSLFIYRPISLFLMLLFLTGVSALYLCEEKRDIIPVIKQIPHLGFLFFVGTVEKLFKIILKKRTC